MTKEELKKRLSELKRLISNLGLDPDVLREVCMLLWECEKILESKPSSVPEEWPFP